VRAPSDDRFDQLTSWHADWRGLRVAVLGLGVTGFAVADTLLELGADVLVVASKATSERLEMLEVIGGRFVEQPGERFVPRELEEFDPELVIVSPGFPPNHVLLDWARSHGLPMWGDIELAWRVRDKVGTPADWILITGTNGKTTTTQLTTHLLTAAGKRAASVGNIGVPPLNAIREPVPYDVLVVELSSFNLHWMPRTGPGAVVPLAAACLNIADDHLDWHGSREAYLDAKTTVYANARIAAVYNRADETTRRMVEQADVTEGCLAVGFGLDTPGPGDFGLVEDLVIDRAFVPDRHRQAVELTTHGELLDAGLGSPHLTENVLAATALARAAGADAAAVRTALATFRVDHHRAERGGSADGVLWVDDSKATNSHAANASLAAFDSVVWIVGGLLKGTDVGPLVERHAARLRGAVVIGVDRQPVVESFARHAPAVPVFEVAASETWAVMPEAVRLAASVARAGDVVLLAPAAASMDQFKDYADRGRRFAEAVLERVGDANDLDASRAHRQTGPAAEQPPAD
jgi:UDP-N-acetylmuramoylalanine--D-glutamate ligase